MHGLAKAGDIISFSKASVLIAELNEVQGRWSVDLMGAHKDRVVEQYCPFPAEDQEEPEEDRQGFDSSTWAEVGSSKRNRRQ